MSEQSDNKGDEHPQLAAAVEEIKRTLTDLQSHQPRLQVAVLLTIPLDNNPTETTATFFATGNLRLAGHVMHRLIMEYENRNQSGIPEAS